MKIIKTFEGKNPMSRTITLEEIMADLEKNLVSSIYQEFKEGEKTSKIELKTKLQKIYDLLGSKQTAKASDLEKYFELKSCKVKNSQTGKWENGFELVKKK